MRDDRNPSLATRVKGYLLGGRNGETYVAYEICAAYQVLKEELSLSDPKRIPNPEAMRTAAQGLASLSPLGLDEQVEAFLRLDARAAIDPKNPERKELEALLAGLAPAATNVLPVKTYDSHRAVAKDFCAFKVRYYVGDIEIINHALAAAGCRYADASLTYTDERYAIYIRMPRTFGDGRYAGDAMHFLRVLSARVYDQNSVLIDAYRATFPKVPPTRQLQALIWSLSGDFPQ